MTTTEQHLLEPAVTDWQPKKGDRVHVHGFDGVVRNAVSDGTLRVVRNGDPNEVAFAWVRPEHMTRLPDPKPAWWGETGPQPGDIGLRDGGTWRCDTEGDVALLSETGRLIGWRFTAPRDPCPVSDLLDQHPTLVIRGGKPWTQP